MATLIATTAETLLQKVGTAVLSTAGSYIAGKGKDYVLDGSDTKKIRDDIAKVATAITEMQHSINQLSDQLTNVLLQLRKDTLRAYLVKINSKYSLVTDTLNACFADPGQLPDDQRKKKLKDAHDRLIELLHGVSLEFSEPFDQIHAFLSEKGPESFLYVAAERALVQSADLMAYYAKVKCMVMEYWVGVAKGIAVMELAKAHPDVHFAGGDDTINRHKAQLVEQETIFRSTVGEDCAAIAEALLSNPNGQTPVRFTAKHGWGIGTNYLGGALTGPSFPVQKWYLQPRTASDMSLDNFDLTIGRKYAVRLIIADGQRALFFSGGKNRNDLSNENDSTHPLSSWYIKIPQPGSSKFHFEFQSNYYHESYGGNFLDVQPIRPENFHTLGQISHLDKNNEGSWFGLQLWK